MLKREDVEGVLPLLLQVSGFAAMQRNSQLIDSRDLLVALYIVDLEHVAEFWPHWTRMEALVIEGIYGGGTKGAYLSRMSYLAQVRELMDKHPGVVREFGRVSPSLQSVISEARRTAVNRNGEGSTPMSKDLLLALWTQDPALKASLEESGLGTKELTRAVLAGGENGKPGAPAFRSNQ